MQCSILFVCIVGGPCTNMNDMYVRKFMYYLNEMGFSSGKTVIERKTGGLRFQFFIVILILNPSHNEPTQLKLRQTAYQYD